MDRSEKMVCPYLLALRLVRICSTKEVLKTRLSELTDMLISRSYNKNVVQAAIEKAEKLDRIETLKKVEKKETNRVILAIR